MIEPRDTPRIDPEGVGQVQPNPSRRFARLVEASAARRLSPRRLAWAAGGVALLFGLVGFGGSRAVDALARWVAARPEHQLAFSEITLVPEPPPWIRSRAAGLLEMVRAEAGHGDRLPVLGLELDAFGVDFKRCPWVAGVSKIERGYHRLIVHLEYRKPVAVAEYDKGGLAVVIDRDGVILPAEDKDIDWAEKGPRYRPRGLATPLIEIRNVNRPAAPRPGFPWKRIDAADDLDGRDHQVLCAAQLAEFLQDAPAKTPGGHPAPAFVQIWRWPDPRGDVFWLYDARCNPVLWGRATAARIPGEPDTAGRWAMLGEWVDRNGPLACRRGEFLELTPSGAERRVFATRDKASRGESTR